MHMFEGIGEKQIRFKSLDSNPEIIHEDEMIRIRAYERSMMAENLPDQKRRIDKYNMQSNFLNKYGKNDASYGRVNQSGCANTCYYPESIKVKKENKMFLNLDKSSNNNECLKNNLTDSNCNKYYSSKNEVYSTYCDLRPAFTDTNNKIMLDKKIDNEFHVDMMSNNICAHESYPKYSEKLQSKISMNYMHNEESITTEYKNEIVNMLENEKNASPPLYEERNCVETLKMKEDIELFMHFIKDVNKNFRCEINYIRENEKPMYYKYKRDDIHDTLCLISESSAFGSDGNEQFSCSFCNMKYTYRRCLMNHIKKKHRSIVK